MPNYPNRKEQFDATEFVSSVVYEAEIGYEAALPFLLGGQDATRWDGDARPMDAPLSYSAARNSPMEAIGPDF